MPNFSIKTVFNRITLCVLCMAFTLSPAIAGSPEWAWDQGSYEQDGTVTLDGEDYTVNPTGTQSLTGKTVRQPPTVIVQSSTGGGGGAVLYAPQTKGNFGGDAYCETHFGPGYVMANVGEMMAYTRIRLQNPNLHVWNNNIPTNCCNNWTNNTSGVSGGTILLSMHANSTLYLDQGSTGCQNSLQVPCIKR